VEEYPAKADVDNLAHVGTESSKNTLTQTVALVFSPI